MIVTIVGACRPCVTSAEEDEDTCCRNKCSAVVSRDDHNCNNKESIMVRELDGMVPIDDCNTSFQRIKRKDTHDDD